MRVPGTSSLERVAAANPVTVRPHAPVAGPAGKEDRFEISARAKEIELARQAVHALPPVREERVASLRAAVEAGQYEVPAEAIAASILAAAARGWG